jgi:ribosomal protein S12 methylthiotransferase accessory factor
VKTDMEVAFPGGKKVIALYKGFIIETDQPEHAGGSGSAPSPFDLFLASIGTCVGYYVLSFCQERNLSTEGLKLDLDTQWDQKTGLVGKINIEIRLPAAFPEKYREAVRRAAELCAVKKHLQDPPQFEITATLAEPKLAAIQE